jgi:hypothetical protein
MGAVAEVFSGFRVFVFAVECAAAVSGWTAIGAKRKGTGRTA